MVFSQSSCSLCWISSSNEDRPSCVLRHILKIAYREGQSFTGKCFASIRRLSLLGTAILDTAAKGMWRESPPATVVMPR